jgi:hypothetical protein
MVYGVTKSQFVPDAVSETDGQRYYLHLYPGI